MAKQPVAQSQQQQTAQAQPTAALAIRTISVPEAVSLAINKRRREMQKGRTSRRVSVILQPHLIPPPSGEYQTYLGLVRIRSVFKPNEGRWVMVVILPETEGFRLSDHISQDPPPTPQT